MRKGKNIEKWSGRAAINLTGKDRKSCSRENEGTRKKEKGEGERKRITHSGYEAADDQYLLERSPARLQRK